MPQNRHVAFGVESTWGTAVAPTIPMRVADEDIEDQIEKLVIKTIDTRAVLGNEMAFRLVRGSVEVICSYQELPTLFYFLLGSASVTGAGPFVHTMPHATNGQADRPSLTVEVRRDDHTQRYAGCKVTGLAISAALNQEARVRVQFIGKAGADASPITPTYRAFEPIIPRHINVSLDNGSTQRVAQSFNLNINYPVDETARLGSIDLALEPEDSDSMEVAGDARILFQDPDDDGYTAFKAGTKMDLQLDMDSGGDEQILVNMNTCLIEQATPHVRARERRATAFRFSAEFATALKSSIQVVATNDVTTLP